MPCNQIILNKIELSAANLGLLTKALELVRYGAGSTIAKEEARRIIAQGFISLPESQEYLADKIRQEYSRQAIQLATRKFNWQVTQHNTQKFTAKRRT